MQKATATPTVVVNVSKKYGETDYVYIGRYCKYTDHKESPFHNPFYLPKDATAEQRRACLAKYEAHVRNSPRLLALLPTLKGKRLGCWCKPLPCHGDVLVKLIQELHPD